VLRKERGRVWTGWYLNGFDFIDLCQVLNVEWTSDVESTGNLPRGNYNYVDDLQDPNDIDKQEW
jgi:hypothetical protein